ncbi:MAG: hypothetical protein DRN24_06375 [Thermoplasmata archaeon]|nr:MAG: hypothetical protein DRN24_06375 [Thermoplasmata archaeon]
MNKKIIPFLVILLMVLAGVGANGAYSTTKSSNNTTVYKDDGIHLGLSDEEITLLQEQAEKEGWTFTVGKNSATDRSLEELCGFIVPEDWWVNARFDPCDTPTFDLPKKFDWREQGGCTPIKNQGHCGSCWAFGTVAPLESLIKIDTGEDVDLSEQWLVSCNQDGWGCDGGWWAHDYFQWKTDKCGDSGAVLEKDCPYTASDTSCNCPYPHEYRITGWHFIGDDNSVPSVNAIKNAIYKHGPVSAAVYVTPAFQAYNGGVFNKDEEGRVNHAVVLVGWDDTQGENGVWILRNSWGSSWGENGYMRIEYGCCDVGYAACYVDGYEPINPDEDKASLTLTIDQITNEGDYDQIDTWLDPRGGEAPEWYYRVGFNDGVTSKYQFNENKKKENDGGWWIFKWNSEHTWNVHQGHLMSNINNPEVEITIKLMDDDVISKDDLADVSAYNGGGKDDDISDKRAAIYHGTYNLITDELTGDATTNDGDYIVTKGDGINNAKIRFKIKDSYNSSEYKPKIDVTPQQIDFGTVSGGGKIYTDSFTIENSASYDPNGWADDLQWTASSDKNWISIDKYAGILSGEQEDTIAVKIDTSSMKKGKTYSGTITIHSNDEYGNEEIHVGVSISIKTARPVSFFPSFHGFYKYIELPRLLYQQFLKYFSNSP